MDNHDDNDDDVDYETAGNADDDAKLNCGSEGILMELHLHVKLGIEQDDHWKLKTAPTHTPQPLYADGDEASPAC